MLEAAESAASQQVLSFSALNKPGDSLSEFHDFSLFIIFEIEFRHVDSVSPLLTTLISSASQTGITLLFIFLIYDFVFSDGCLGFSAVFSPLILV